MEKPLLFLAFMANAIYLALSSDQYSSSSAVASASSSSSNSYASASAYSSSYSSSQNRQQKPKKDDCNNCGPNETEVPCPEAVCVPKSCDDLGYPIPCYDLPPNGRCPSPPGCICNEGYVRNCEDRCIPMSHCPSCGGDPNAQSGCGINCNNRCSSQNNTCIDVCYFNACDCKKGYLLDETTNKCVEPCDCPTPKCKKNEVYDLCPAPCPLRTCGINDAAVDCVPSLEVGDPNCNPPKCRCKDGFYKNNFGECVRWENCPRCDNPNEEYDPCIAPCPPRVCSAAFGPALPCVPPPPIGDPSCVAGCRCSDGYYKDDRNVCVPKDQCKRCPKNQVYDECIAPCPPRRCDVDDRVIRCAAPPKKGSPDCKSGCRCADGYYTNANGTCVTRDECPLPCKSDEVYELCPPFLCKPLSCSEVGYPGNCVTQEYGCPGNAACICADDNVRNDQGKCVPRNKCPSCGGDPNAVAGCGVNCNKRCRDIGKKTGLCTEICYENACNCKKDFYLDENTNKCVLPKQCTPQCGPNEKYNECINGGCQPKNCSQVGFPIKCPNDPKYCIKGCQCTDGYVRNETTGFCIPIQDCPSCGGDVNAQSGCGTNCNKLCSNIGKEPGFCLGLCKVNGCDCKKGYYFDTNRQECVKPEACTPTCGTNEVYSDCANANCSPQNCTQLGYPIACPAVSVCTKGCLCKDGYLRNDKGICIPSRECPPTCGINEEYNTCTNANCDPQNCTQVGFSVPCRRIDPASCEKGCQCKSGYARNDKRVCIPIEQCPSCGGDKNAQSGCGGYCNRRCSDIGKKPRPCPKICGINACDCKKGYYLDDNTNKCVKKENCSPTCGVNEEYNQCVEAICTPTNCSQLGYPIACVDIDPQYCTKGCTCKPGYVKNYKGVCISDKECPSCGGDPNAESGCGGFCDKRCSDVGKEPRACILLCILNGCNCKEGYLRDDNTNKCVKLEDCSPKCNENEVYSECSNANCSPQSCSKLGFPIPCPIVDSKYCKKECICKPGYVRNDKRICVPSTECPSCGGDRNATAGCGTNCNRRCSDVGNKPGGACAAVCNVNGCDCRYGYYFDTKTDKCVKPDDCSNPKCLAANNEEYSECTNGGCSRRNCSQYGKPVPCVKIDPKYCIKGCVCKEGYLRASNGKCVLQNNCPEACKGPHKQYNNCTYSCPPQTCDTVGKFFSCPAQTKDNCEPLCKCEKGYYKNKAGDCVTEEQCFQCLPENNEVYSNCTNGGCTWRNCSQYGTPVACGNVNSRNCIRGCICKDGYLRASNGQCIPQYDCPEACKGPHEVYNNCSYNCPPQICESLDRSYACPINKTDSCKPMCRCEPGYYRNFNRECITEAQCRKCLGSPHQYYSCGGACDNKCYNIKEQNQTNCPIINIKCNEMCYCEKDYARALNGTCIPISSCNEPQCPINERYEQCPGFFCEPLTCSQLGVPIACPASEGATYCPYEPDCVCIDGYLRNYEGICVPVNNCPTCGGDPNAQPGCGVNCGKYCTDLLLDPNNIACIEICYFNACDCKDGFYYDTNLYQCVPPGQCTDVCGINEMYEDCSNPSCRPQNCTEVGFPQSCDAKCKKGCICKENYVRNEKGICTPIQDCPRCGGDPNAVSGCGVNCGKLCPNNDRNPNICPRICYPNACDCKDGFVFDNNTKTCVKSNECSPRCDDAKNEEYDSCINGGCSKRNCSQLGRPDVCIRPRSCIKGCKCKEGYLRKDDGTCVPIGQCPTVGCGGDPNAKPGCGYNCGRKCPRATSTKLCPRIVCKPDKCDCIDGFLYDSNMDKCVKQEDCTPVCNSLNNEVYDSCTNGGCDKKNCSQLADPIICIDVIKCEIGCKCKDGYLRLKNGTCVPIDKCPEPKCKKNERFEKCPGKVCEPQYCNVVGYPLDCPDDAQCGLPTCICQSGYARQDGICIPIDQCPNCGGDPNAEPGCGLNCNKQCPKKTKHPCPRIVCKRNGCECKDGFLYDRNTGSCVREQDCTPVCNSLNNEVYDSCTNGGCDKKNCSQLADPIICIDVIKCEIGCKCKDGYLRLKNGTCVPIDKCPAPKCKKNERFEKCPGKVCEPQYCNVVGYPLDCPDDAQCGLPTCICQFGYARQDGVCIPIDQCPNCGGDPNAEPGCGLNCNKQCPKKTNHPCPRIVCKRNGCECKDGFLYDKNTGSCVREQDCTPICDASNNEVYDSCTNGGCDKKKCSQLASPAVCVDVTSCDKGCKCKNGYLRLNNGTCVPVDQCPEPKCKKNERFEKCPGKVCEPQYCNVVGYPLDCPDDAQCGLPTCICEYGYARQDGVCIPNDECPTCGGDPNATPGCGYHCPDSCPKAINPAFCPRIQCQPKSCDCKYGYLYDANIQMCVKPNECSPICDKSNNEVYDPCTNGGCGWKNCTQVGGPQICIDVTKCDKGCSCKKDYYRLGNGTCVPEDQCPPNCQGQNEVYDPCPPYCSPQTCRSISEPPYCPKKPDNYKCTGTCRCKPNFYRNSINECISKKKCLQCNGPFEYFSCGSYCDNVCSKLDTETRENCPVQTFVCVPRCYCEDGYARDDKGICIPISQCPPRPTTVNATTSLANFQKGNLNLAANFLYETLQEKPGQSFVFSTLSILIALGQLVLGAVGVNLQQLLKIMNLDNKEQVETIFPIMIENFKAQKDVMFKIADKLYCTNKYPITPYYGALSKKTFDADVETLDFSQSKLAADTINKWVANITNGLITGLVEESMFNANTRAAMVNALYFLGNWQKQFNANNTKDRDFYTDNTKTIKVKTMNQKGSFKYAVCPDLKSTIMELPYKGANFTFVIVLPDDRTGLKEVVGIIQKDSSLMTKCMALLRFEEVIVYLPKMDISSRWDLIPLLQKFGVIEAFKSDSNGFKDVLQNEEPLHISDAVHECVMKVDETGTEAAAATAIILTRALAVRNIETYTFDANHPYAFFLLNKDSVVFSGCFSK